MLAASTSNHKLIAAGKENYLLDHLLYFAPGHKRAGVNRCSELEAGGGCLRNV